MNYGETVGILGFGVEGKSTLRYLIREGVQKIVVMDKNPIELPLLPANISVQFFSGESYLNGLNSCQTVIRSAGIYPITQELLRFQMRGGVLTSQTEIFFDSVHEKQVIGVTGTLGKGSTVSMIKKILDQANIPSIIGGNFGVPMLDLLSEESDDSENEQERIYILELSSFQLMTLGVSPHISILLKISSEHLDWHKSVEEYRDAKTNLVRYQKKNDFCIYSQNAEPSVYAAKSSAAQKLSYGSSLNDAVQIIDDSLRIGERILKLSECKTRGVYQLENMAASALAALALGVDIEMIFKALRDYETLPLRMEFRGEWAGIEFFNDSYATRPDATEAAVKSMRRPFALILGGSEKNADFTEMFTALKQNKLLQNISFIGATANRMKEAANKIGLTVPLEIYQTLEEAFERSVQIGAGGAVLLSPACASFGLFKNYKVRGEVFNALVESFAQKQSAAKIGFKVN